MLLPCVHSAEHPGKTPLCPGKHTCSRLQVLDGVVAAAVDDAGGEDETLLTEQRALEPQNAMELQLGLLQARLLVAPFITESEGYPFTECSPSLRQPGAAERHGTATGVSAGAPSVAHAFTETMQSEDTR